jgi:queuine tRNA-ribosyltransferase
MNPTQPKLFEIKTKSKISKARTGKLTFAHGTVQTPVFMGIGTAGSVKGLDYKDLIKLNAQIILGNTYHLWLRPGMEVIQKAGGLHEFIHWDRPILTDSGGFQAFSLNKIRKFSDEGVFFDSQVDGQKRFLSPEISMAIQTIIGSDIALVLDECLPAEVTEETAKSAMNRTFAWAKRSKDAFEKFRLQNPSSNDLENLEKAHKAYAQGKLALEKKVKNFRGNDFQYQAEILIWNPSRCTVCEFKKRIG